MEKIAVMLNVGAGAMQRDAAVKQLQEFFSKYEVSAKIFLCQSGEELELRCAAAIQEGFTILAAAGGDGTVSAVARLAAEHGLSLAVIPIGTLNHFAQDLGVPLALEDAVQVLAHHQMRSVDMGEVNGQLFVNNCNIGLYPKIVQLRESIQSRGWKKWQALAVASLTIFGRFPKLIVKLTMGDHEVLRRTPLVFVGNNAYGLAGDGFGRRAHMDQNNLSVFVAHRPTKFAFLKLLFHIYTGKLREQKEFEEYYTEKLLIETSKKQLPVALDGEVRVLASPLEFKILPKKLKVLVPQIPEGETYSHEKNDPFI